MAVLPGHAVYINHLKLSNAQKFYHLRYKTKGQAAVMVKHFTLNDDNFNLATHIDSWVGKYMHRRIPRKIVTFMGAIALNTKEVLNVATNKVNFLTT